MQNQKRNKLTYQLIVRTPLPQYKVGRVSNFFHKKGGVGKMVKKGLSLTFILTSTLNVLCALCVCLCMSMCVCLCEINIVCNPPSFCWGVEPEPNFQKGGELGLTSAFRWRVAGKEGVTFSGGLQFSHKNKLKSDIVNDKKSLQAQIFFFVITKHLN